MGYDESKFIELTILDKNVKIPNWYNMNAEIEYFESYKKDQNCRKAFCNIVFIMIERKKDRNDNIVIGLENIETISDDELIKIMNLYLTDKESNLQKYFKENFKGDYFEAFYLTLKKQKDELCKQLGESIGNLSIPSIEPLKPLLNTIINMKKLTKPIFKTNIHKTLETLEKFQKSSQIDRYSAGSFPPIKPPKLLAKVTNKLLLELNEHIEKSQDAQLNYQTQNNEYSLRMVELLADERSSREKLEKANKKADKRNLIINIIIVVVAILTLIATCIGIGITLYFSVWFNK